MITTEDAVKHHMCKWPGPMITKEGYADCLKDSIYHKCVKVCSKEEFEWCVIKLAQQKLFGKDFVGGLNYDKQQAKV